MKITLLPGLGSKPSDYVGLSSLCEIADLDWNNLPLTFGDPDILVGHSMGAVLACQHAVQKPVETLVLCSASPGAETMKDIKAKRVVVFVGENEKWLIKDAKRLLKTLPKETLRQLDICKNTDHHLNGEYMKALNVCLISESVFLLGQKGYNE